MRRGVFDTKYLTFILFAGILQLFAIISDQIVLQLDAYVKKDESHLILSEMQSENTLTINLLISDIQRYGIDVMYYIDEYNESIEENEKFKILSRIHKTGSDLYHIVTSDYVNRNIFDKKIINEASNLIRFEINEKNFDNYYDQVLDGFFGLNVPMEHFANLIWQSIDEVDRLNKKISYMNKLRHRLILFGVISQIFSLLSLLLFFRIIIVQRTAPS